jgi:hypothetical protein
MKISKKFQVIREQADVLFAQPVRRWENSNIDRAELFVGCLGEDFNVLYDSNKNWYVETTTNLYKVIFLN